MSNQNTAPTATPKAELAVMYEVNGEQIKLTPKADRSHLPNSSSLLNYAKFAS